MLVGFGLAFSLGHSKLFALLLGLGVGLGRRRGLEQVGTTRSREVSTVAFRPVFAAEFLTGASLGIGGLIGIFAGIGAAAGVGSGIRIGSTPRIVVAESVI